MTWNYFHSVFERNVGVHHHGTMVRRRQRIRDAVVKHGVIRSAVAMHGKNISLSDIYQKLDGSPHPLQVGMACACTIDLCAPN